MSAIARYMTQCGMKDRAGHQAGRQPHGIEKRCRTRTRGETRYALEVGDDLATSRLADRLHHERHPPIQALHEHKSGATQDPRAHRVQPDERDEESRDQAGQPASAIPVSVVRTLS